MWLFCLYTGKGYATIFRTPANPYRQFSGRVFLCPIVSYPSKSLLPNYTARLLPIYLTHLSAGFFDKTQILFSIPHYQQFSIDNSTGKLYPYWEGFPSGEHSPSKDDICYPPPITALFSGLFLFLNTNNLQ